MADFSIYDVWGKRDLGQTIQPIDWNKPIRHSDVDYLLKCYPFLQIMNGDPHFGEEIEVVFLRATCGWIIHDYGDALSVSPGHDLFGPGQPEKENEDEGGGQGTVIAKSYATAYEMMGIAHIKGWAGVQLVDGTPFMQWAAWMAASDQELQLYGYTPSAEDVRKRARVIKILGEKQRASLENRLGLRR